MRSGFRRNPATPIRGVTLDGRFGAWRPVPAEVPERPLWVRSRDLSLDARQRAGSAV